MSADATSAPLTVYVAYHDSRPHPGPGDAPYLAVCNVRPDGSRPEGFPAYDDDGGFPDRNAAYCELSVLRRLETRATTDWVGLSHYRRLLLTRPPSDRRGDQPGSFVLAGWDWSQAGARGGSADALLKALSGYDWATPAPYDVRRAGFRSLAEQFAVNHPGELLRVADEAVRECHPHLPSFAEHLGTTTATPLFNVFMGRRELLRDYTAFLWPVLEACGERWPPAAGDRYQGRWAGFLAERLHGYWIEHVARPAGARVAVLPLAVLVAGNGAPASGVRARAVHALPPAVVLAAHRARWRLAPSRDPRRARPALSP